MFFRLLISAVAVWITSSVLDGVAVQPWWATALVAIVLGFINAVIRPIVNFFSFPLNFMTLGLFTFVINAAMVMLAAWVLGDHFRVDSFGWALAFSIVLTIVAWLLNLITPSSDD